MATLTKKTLLEAIEDMPMDAKIRLDYFIDNPSRIFITDVEYDKVNNEILLSYQKSIMKLM